MEELKEELDKHVVELHNKVGNMVDLSDDFLDELYSVYPFNRFEYVISHLIAYEIIDIDNYLEIRNNYFEQNKFLHIFEINAPRTFGEKWAQNHINEFVPELKRPAKKYDSDYAGQYDFWLDGIRIEVKASRAVDKDSEESLVMKALSTQSERRFDMNFQQIKPACCDVFVWVGVWRDEIRYWVLSSDEVKDNKNYSTGQHRGNTGEGQLWVTQKNIKEFEEYLVNPRDLFSKIKEKGMM